jgi:DNA repair exonuclease SbcCD ATPase subunit
MSNPTIDKLRQRSKEIEDRLKKIEEKKKKFKELEDLEKKFKQRFNFKFENVA